MKNFIFLAIFLSTSLQIRAQEEILDAPLLESVAAPSMDDVLVPDENSPGEVTPAEALTAEPAPVPVIELEPLKETPKVAPAKRDTSFAVRGIAPQSQEDLSQEERFNHRASHWVSTLGFEYTKYTLPYEFQGAKAKFGEEERELFGGRIGVGREYYLGKGFLFQGRLDGYYLGTLFTQAQTGNPEVDIEVSATKKTGSAFGGEAVAHLGWMFDFRTKNPFLGEMNYMALEFFAEAGVGAGKDYNRKQYYFEASPATSEEYNLIIENKFMTRSLSAGVNILSVNSGAFFFMKATQMTQDISERKFRGVSRPNGQPATRLNGVDKSVAAEQLTLLSFGGGYKF